MPKLFALTQIIMPPNKDGNEVVVPRRTVFDATVAQAKQFDTLKAARPATEAEIKLAAEKEALTNATAYVEEAAAVSQEVADTNRPAVDVAPESGAPGDPLAKPKGSKG